MKIRPVLFLILVLAISSCEKFPEKSNFIQFRTVKSRLTRQTWNYLQSYQCFFDQEKEYPLGFKNISLDFKRNGDLIYLYELSKSNDPGLPDYPGFFQFKDSAGTGRWELLKANDPTQLRITIEGISFDFEINALNASNLTLYWVKEDVKETFYLSHR
ncbi:MAG: hypothetical protein KJ941_12560 [Bacteroidetes bacterium]|nr:hypothetical protein [Bacteroidota bacterium]